MTGTDTRELTPTDIIRMGKTAFCTAKILHSALELKLFGLLGDRALQEREIREAIGLHSRASRDFLDSLVALGVLNLRDGLYSNSFTARQFLDPENPEYVGKFLERSSRVLYPAWGDLTNALMDGMPRVADSFRDMLQDESKLNNYLGMMDSLSSMVAPSLANMFDWGGVKKLVDVGGARGNLAGIIASTHPHLEIGVFDLPPMEKHFHDHMKNLGVDERASFHSGDFLVDPLPRADVVIIGHVLHNWSPKERRMLIGKAFEAVRPSGTLIVYERLLEEEPTDPENFVISLDMLLTTDAGSEYRTSDLREWVEEAGFTFESAAPVGEDDTVVVARRSG